MFGKFSVPDSVPDFMSDFLPGSMLASVSGPSEVATASIIRNLFDRILNFNKEKKIYLNS